MNQLHLYRIGYTYLHPTSKYTTNASINVAAYSLLLALDAAERNLREKDHVVILSANHLGRVDVVYYEDL